MDLEIKQDFKKFVVGVVVLVYMFLIVRSLETFQLQKACIEKTGNKYCDTFDEEGM